jgi:hypothetical protein
MPIDETTPDDDSLIGAFAANERAHRGVVKALVQAEHDGTTGRHEIARVADAAARDALFTTPEGGNLCYRRDTDALELYDENVPGWVRVVGVGSIALDEVDDDSPDAATQQTDEDAGTQQAPVLATTARGELRQLRRQLKRQKVGLATKRVAGTADATWIEQPARGANHVKNARFALFENGLFPFWSKIGSPSTYAQVQRATAGGLGFEARVVATGAGQGHRQTFRNLRPSSTYLLRVQARVASGSIGITTTGGSGPQYGNASGSLTTSLAHDGESVHLIRTDAGPTNVVLDILSQGSAEFYVAEADLIPLWDTPRASVDLPMRWVRHVVKESGQSCPAATDTLLTGLDITSIVPEGYGIRVTASVNADLNSGSNEAVHVWIRETVGATSTFFARNVIFCGSSGRPGSAVCHYARVPSGAPYVTLQHRVEVHPYNQAFTFAPQNNGQQLACTLEVEVYRVG